MFGGVRARVVARQSVGVSSDTLLLRQELRGRGREERHVVHGAHRLELGGGDQGAVARHGLPLQGAIEVFQEVRLERQRARPR